MDTVYCDYCFQLLLEGWTTLSQVSPYSMSDGRCIEAILAFWSSVIPRNRAVLSRLPDDEGGEVRVVSGEAWYVT